MTHMEGAARAVSAQHDVMTRHNANADNNESQDTDIDDVSPSSDNELPPPLTRNPQTAPITASEFSPPSSHASNSDNSKSNFLSSIQFSSRSTGFRHSSSIPSFHPQAFHRQQSGHLPRTSSLTTSQLSPTTIASSITGGTVNGQSPHLRKRSPRSRRRQRKDRRNSEKLR